MNTSVRMSGKMNADFSQAAYKQSEKFYAAIAFLGGLALFIASITFDSEALALIAFLPLVIGGLHLNNMFWIRVMGDRMPRDIDNYKYRV